jgi:Cys-tRNA(Pro)/Cys-tRNA(Cys) deacylase
VIADESIAGHEWVFVSAGQRGLQVEVRPGDVTRLTGARLAPVAS